MEFHHSSSLDLGKNNLVLPLVDTLDIFPYKSNSLQITDVNMAIENLGYIPYNIIEIGSKDYDGRPTVLILYALNKNDRKRRNYLEQRPFPTMAWMCCPNLKAVISRLEVVGWIQKLQERLYSSPEYLEQMRNAHLQYAHERWSAISEEDKMVIESNRGWIESLRDVGIAGIKDFSRVKCLHCHYAHFLARPQHGNLIGEWVHQILTDKIAL